MTTLLVSFFYAPAWVFPGDFLFTLAVGDVIITSYHFLSMLHPFQMSHPIRGFPALTHPCTCMITIWRGYSQLHSSSNFRRGNILCSQHTSTDNTSLTWMHTFKVSVCCWCAASTLLIFQHTSHLLVCILMTNVCFSFLLKMVDWTFEDALTTIQSLPFIPASILQSVDGICLGDICFAMIHTTLQMHAIPLTILEKWVENGSFNPEHMVEGDYSHSTAILLTLNPDAQCKDIESVGIRLIVHQHKALLGQISSIPHLIRYTCSLMEAEGQSAAPIQRTYCMIMGNYSGHMPFATDPPFCIVYSWDFVNEDEPAKMMFRNQENHPVSFTTDGLMVCQLLAWDGMEHEYTMTTHN